MMFLCAASFVLRHKLPDSDAIHITGIISDLLIDDMTLDRACQLTPTGSLKLFGFQWERGLNYQKHSFWSVSELLHTEIHYFQWEFSRALQQAVRRADLKMIQWLLKHFPECSLRENVLEEAAEFGQVWVFQLLEDDKHHAIQWSEDVLIAAATRGHWGLVHWLDERVFAQVQMRSFLVMNDAIKQNNLDEVKWLLAKNFPAEMLNFSFPECSNVQWKARKEIVKCILEEGHIDAVFVSNAVEQAAQAGDLDFLQWIVEGYVEDLTTPPYSAKGLLFKGLEVASEHGQFAEMDWLLSRIAALGISGGPAKAMFAAVKGGQLHWVDYLWEEYSEKMQYEIFKGPRGFSFVRDENGQVQRNARGIMIARRTGTAAVMDIAAEYGHLDVLEFLHKLDLLQQNNQNTRCQMCTHKAIDKAAGAGHLHVVKWLHQNRFEGCTSAAIDLAAANFHLEVVKWLDMNRSEGFTTAAIDKAAERYHHDKSAIHGINTTCCADKVPKSSLTTS